MVVAAAVVLVAMTTVGMVIFDLFIETPLCGMHGRR